MRYCPYLLVLLVALAGGCAPVPSVAADNARIDAALVEVGRQVRRCYRFPRVSFQGRQISTRLRVRVTQDGQVASLPIVVFQDGVTPANQAYAGRMAEAAIEAVMRCAPIRLPDSAYQNGWTEFELTFSPLAVG